MRVFYLSLLVIVGFAFSALAIESVELHEDSPAILETVNKAKSKSGESTYLRVTVRFKKDLNEAQIEHYSDPGRWRVSGRDGDVVITDIQFASGLHKDQCFLYGDFEAGKSLVLMVDQAEYVVEDKAQDHENTFSFGTNYDMQLGLRRFTSIEAQGALDYNIAISIMKINLGNFSDILFDDVDLKLASTGSFTTEDRFQHGTESSGSLNLLGYYDFLDELYEFQASGGFQFDTATDTLTDELLHVVNQHATGSLQLEIPLTNLIVGSFPKERGFLRMTSPLVVSGIYHAEGEDQDKVTVPARKDLRIWTEAPLSPLFILQFEAQWCSWDKEIPGMDRDNRYLEFTWAQDLDRLKYYLGPLSLLLGSAEEMRNKYFFYIRYGAGQKAPLFQDVEETSFGFAMYL